MIPQEVENWQNQWKDVRFEDTVKIVSISRGRSAANFNAFSEKSKCYHTIFISDFLEMAINGDVAGNVISGTFKVMKKGRNFGIKLEATPKRKSQDIDWHDVNGRIIPEYI